MNRTESVSIGRKGFICEQDAYKILQEYLTRSEKALLQDPDQEEILADLELSMASHLTELSGELVVDKDTAHRVISLMGEVEVEAGDTKKNRSDDEEPTTPSQDMSFSDRLRNLVKKPLYKDHDREIGDGVCAGIAKVLDVDPVWVRLLFVVITIMTQGLGIVLYIVLSIIMKEESSYKKKTAGEVVDNIRKQLTTTANGARPYERALRKLIAGVLIIVWVILRTFVCIVLVAASITWASYMFFMLNSPDQVAIFNGRPGWLEFIMVFSAGLVLLIPLFELLVVMFRPKGNRSRLSLALWSVWALSLIALVASVVNVYPKVEKYLKTERPKNDFVYVQMAGDEIASLCISPLGTCSDMEQTLTYERICDQEVNIYEKDDRPVWQMRGWNNVSKSLEYPVSEEQYCNEIRQIIQQEGRNRVLFARQELNSMENVSREMIVQNQGVPNTIVPADREYWTMEYLTRY